MLNEWTKWVEPIIYPLGIVWLTFVVGFFIFLFKKRWVPALICLIWAGALTVFGSTIIPYKLLAQLETPYIRKDLKAVPSADAVVMLGGVLSPSPNDLHQFELSPAADRLITAVELIRAKKASALVLGGGNVQGGKSEPELLQAWIKAWDLSRTPVITLKGSLNTREEAVQVKKLMEEKGWKKILLVTSAYHMKRSEALFRTQGITLEPVACDFIGTGTLAHDIRFNVIPQLQHLEVFNTYLHEKAGWQYYRWRGWIE